MATIYRGYDISKSAAGEYIISLMGEPRGTAASEDEAMALIDRWRREAAATQNASRQ